ncbi:MAG: hypothetical protein WCT14_15570 [Treponemataceae bacterium]
MCWGDAALPWLGDGGLDGGKATVKDDFFVMEGERRYDEIGLFDLSVGNSGLECLLVPGSVGFAQATVQGDEKISLAWSSPGNARLNSHGSSTTDPRGGYKAATIKMSIGSNWKWLIVRGRGGQRFSLRFFPTLSGNVLAKELVNKTDTEIAVRAIGSVEGEDSVPFTARAYVLNSVDGRTYAIAAAAERALTLSSSVPVRLKSNLLDRNSFLLNVEERGKYVVLEKDPKKASALWSFFPLDGFSFNRKDSRTAKSGDSVELIAGKYLLVMEVKTAGTLDALIARDGLETKLGGMGLWKRESEASGNVLSWYGLRLPETNAYRKSALAFGERAGVVQGFSVRISPLALSEKPFSVHLEAGKTVHLAATLERPSFLRFANPRVRVLVNGSLLNETESYPAGSFELRFSAADGKEAWACVEALPVSDAPAAERYSVFREGAPFWTEFDRKEIKRFILNVDAPALYTVSTTGRLETNIRLRSRMRPTLAAASDGGPGRNARVSAYLKAGEYMVEVGVSGASKGAAGIALERRPVRVLPPLRDAGKVRATAEAGEALIVPVEIPSAGSWRLNSFGLARAFPYRLEDSLGWPPADPIGNASYSGPLASGSYRFISLAAAVPTRRVFTLENADEGKGFRDSYSPEAVAAAKSFHVELGRSYSRSWRGEGADEAVIDLAAPVSVRLTLSPEMAYRLTLPDGSAGDAGLGSKNIDLDLPLGKTVVHMTPLIADQDHAYSVRFDCPDLMENRPLPIQAGSVVPLSVGRKGNWELETSGGRELEAALFASSGKGYRLVATSRTIADDWNCIVSAPLESGRYVVKFAAPGDPRLVDPPNAARLNTASSGDSIARLRFRSNAAVHRQTGAFTLSADLSSDFLAVDFAADKTGPYRFSVDSADSSELFVEKGDEMLAFGKTEAIVSLVAGTNYRVRCGRSGEGTARVGLSCVPIGFAEIAVGKNAEIDTNERAVLVRDAARMSRVVDSPDVLVAFGAEKQFLPAEREPFRADGAWLLRADGNAIGRIAIPPVVASSGALSLPLNAEGQKIAVPVPEGHVALVRVASRGFETSITETRSIETGSEIAVDWNASFVTSERSVLGLAPGEHLVVVRDSRPKPDGRLVPVSADSVPIVRRERLVLGETRSFTLEAGSAVALSTDGDRPGARVSLERGLAAFDAGGRTTKTVDSFSESDTFAFEELSGTLYLVNSGNRAAIASVEIEPKGSFTVPFVVERDGFESVVDRAQRLTLRIDGRDAASELAAAGDIASFHFFDEDSGVVTRGTPVATVAGPMIVAKGRRGRLELEARPGFVKVFLAKSSEHVDAFVELPAGLYASALGSGRLVSGKDARKFIIENGKNGGLLSASASGGGVLALIDPKGNIVAADAGVEGQETMALAESGSYAVFARPFKNASRTGSVAADIAIPETVEKSGALPGRLATEGRLQAYRFKTAFESQVGAGIRAERDGLRVRLFDASLALIDEGPALIRKLPQGSYYLVVSSEKGTVRYQPVWFGIEGDRAEVPDDVVAKYLRNGEQ